MQIKCYLKIISTVPTVSSKITECWEKKHCKFIPGVGGFPHKLKSGYLIALFGAYIYTASHKQNLYILKTVLRNRHITAVER